MLKQRETRKRIASLQKSHGWIFDKELVEAQVAYLLELIEEYEDDKIVASKYKKTNKLLRDIFLEDRFNDLVQYNYQRSKLEKFINLEEVSNRTDERKLWEMEQTAQILYDNLIEHSDNTDELMKEQQNLNAKYHCEDEEYIVRSPHDLIDFVNEAKRQDNCLVRYYEAYANGETTILFLRKKQEPEKSFITMEAYEGNIIQAYGRFNSNPDEETKDYILRYAEKHNLGVADMWNRAM